MSNFKSFKIGDKFKVLDQEKIWLSNEDFENGKIYESIRLKGFNEGILILHNSEKNISLYVYESEYKYLEKVES